MGICKWGNDSKAAPEFTLGTGDVDELHFDEENSERLILNRLGLIKLLSSIEKQCSGYRLCNTWKSVKRYSSTFLDNDFKRDNQSTQRGDRQYQRQGTIVRPLTAPSTCPPTAPTHRFPSSSHPTHVLQASSHPNFAPPWHSLTRSFQGAPLRSLNTSVQRTYSHPAPQTAQRQRYSGARPVDARKSPPHSYAAATQRAPPRSMGLGRETRWEDERGG